MHSGLMLWNGYNLQEGQAASCPGETDKSKIGLTKWTFKKSSASSHPQAEMMTNLDQDVFKQIQQMFGPNVQISMTSSSTSSRSSSPFIFSPSNSQPTPYVWGGQGHNDQLMRALAEIGPMN